MYIYTIPIQYMYIYIYLCISAKFNKESQMKYGANVRRLVPEVNILLLENLFRYCLPLFLETVHL